jgi:hypothetical protein
MRWNSEAGELVVVTLNDVFEREPRLVELNTPQATFAWDMATRERGYGLIMTGFYKMALSPVGSVPPTFPEPVSSGGKNYDYKPAVGMWVWNPAFGLLRVETNAAYFRMAISAIWDRFRSFTEATAGLQPVVRVTGRREVVNKEFNKLFFSPIHELVGWVQRDKIASFKDREPTVPPPPAVDAQIPFMPTASLTDLQARTQKKLSSAKAPKCKTPDVKTGDIIDDVLPW